MHFAALGAMLFALSALARRGAADRRAQAPAPVRRTVVIATSDVDAARASFRAASKREPSPQELADLVQGVISEELLFREGLALGLDRDDRVVRRRVIEKMTALARPTAPDSDPPRDELARHYQLYQHRFAQAAAVSFEQLYFDPARRGDATAAASQALAALDKAGAADPAPAGVGDASVLPATMKRRSQLELAHLMGEGFATAVFAAPIGRWHGPVPSPAGRSPGACDRARARAPAPVRRGREAGARRLADAGDARPAGRGAQRAAALRDLAAARDAADAGGGARAGAVPGTGAMTRAARIVLASLAVAFALPAAARAHDLRPALLSVTQVGAEQYDVEFRVPIEATLEEAPAPIFPAGSERVGGTTRTRFGAMSVERFRVQVPGGLAGRRLGVRFAGGGGSEVLVRVASSDGAHQRRTARSRSRARATRTGWCRRRRPRAPWRPRICAWASSTS